ncbi:YggS family pyridoxal phosphate-dependent enzyme [Bacillus sp. FSL W7-1360]
MDIRHRIMTACEKSGRAASSVRVVAVTKNVGVPTIHRVLAAGIYDIGENRVDTALEKMSAVTHNKAVWHFIGSLQSKKAKHVASAFTYIHSLDRLRLAQALDKRLDQHCPLKCFVQVNVSGEKTKAGLRPHEVKDFIAALADFPSLQIVGLMTMAPFVRNAEEVRPVFRALRLLRDDIQSLQLSHAPCKALSMGMSNDYQVAIEEGATFIRLGTSLVGNETLR